MKMNTMDFRATERDEVDLAKRRTSGHRRGGKEVDIQRGGDRGAKILEATFDMIFGG
jgi:hypothetical protein